MLHWWQILFKLGILGSLPQLRARVTIEHILLDYLHFPCTLKENPEAPNSTQPKLSAFTLLEKLSLATILQHVHKRSNKGKQNEVIQGTQRD